MEDNELCGRELKKVNLKPDNVSAMYAVINKKRKPTTDDTNTLTEDEIGALYTVVNKAGKSAGNQKGKVDKNRSQDVENNELSEDVSGMYTQVNKKKTKDKK